MRKILSLILAALMLIIPTSAFAEATDVGELSENSVMNDFVLAQASASPVFDADFSAYTNQNPTITDKSGNNISVIQNAGKPSANTEVIGTNSVKNLNFENATKASEFVNFKIDKSSKIVGLSDMTIEIWAKPNVTDNVGRVLFSLSKSTVNNSSYNATLTSKKMTVNLNGQTAECDIENYMNKWTQFAFVRSYDDEEGTATLKVYMNGDNVIDTSFAETKKADESDKFLYIGSYGDNKTSQWEIQYVGGISELRVYDASLTSSVIGLNYIQQMQAYKDNSGDTDPVDPVDPDNPEQPTDPDTPDNPEAPNEEGIIFDLDIGDTLSSLKDVSGNNITGISTAGSVSVQKYQGLEGDINYVAIDNSVDTQYVKVTDSKLLNNTNTTIEFVMKTPLFDKNRWPKHFGIESEASSNYSLWFETGDPGYFIFTDHAIVNNKPVFRQDGIASTAQRNGEWMHLVLTRAWDEDAKKITLKAYMNGLSLSASAGQSMSGTKTNMTTPGDPSDASYYFGCSVMHGNLKRDGYRGGLAELRVYNKIMTETEISQNYNEFKTKYAPKPFGLKDGETFKRETKGLSYQMLGGNSAVNDITITDALTGKPFNAKVTATEDGFDISFNQYLKYGQTLKLNSPSLNASVSETVSKGNSEISAELYNSDLTLVTELDGSNSYKINLTVKNKAASQDYKYIVVARDENGASVSSHSGSISVASDENNDFFTITDTKEAKEISIYVWESTEGMLIPVYGSPIKIN